MTNKRFNTARRKADRWFIVGMLWLFVLCAILFYSIGLRHGAEAVRDSEVVTTGKVF